jgi:ketopantoate hydroxymethyltransferase
LGEAITEAVGRYAFDVRNGLFPDASEAYENPDELLE